MIGIEKISNSISEKIASELNLDQDKKEVINYGTFSLIQMILSIGLVLLFGILFRVTTEALMISFVIGILRKYSGGVHASTPAGCNIIGTFVCIIEAIIFSYIYSLINISWIIVIGIMVFIWAYYTIFKLAPVDNPAKPIKKESKRKRLKKISNLILSMYLILNIVNIIMYMYQAESKFIVYSLCICGGVLWQVFTLTKIGHILLERLDFFLNQILRLGGVN